MCQFVLYLCLALIFYHHATPIKAKTVFHRINKITDDFKQQNLLPEQIDPNVAPSYITSTVTSSGTSVEVVNDVGNGDGDVVGAVAVVAGDDYGPVEDEFIATTTPAPLTTTTVAATSTTAIDDNDNLNGLVKYCKCSDDSCNCCRNFNIPFIPIKGPGCANIRYLGDEKLSLSLKYGDLTLASRNINSRKARPVCVNLPGGYSSFCSRVYGVSKVKSNFKACLGFELRADDEVEAAMRVSCFKFGPDGLKVAEAEPFPVPAKSDEDDDDYPFGFDAGGGDDDDDDDDDDEDEDDDYDEYNEDEDDDDEESPTDADYGTFSLDALFDDDDDDKNNKINKITDTITTTLATNFDLPQSKDDKSLETIQPIEIHATTLSTNKIKTKKMKKPKKQKSTDSSENGLTYTFINGLLEFFN